MAGNGLEVGTGVLLITALWICALVVGALLLRASGPAQLGVVPVFLLALSITLALVLIPRAQETSPAFKEIEIEDSLFIGRYVLLAVATVVFLLAFFLLLPFHFLEPVYAKALKTH